MSSYRRARHEAQGADRAKTRGAEDFRPSVEAPTSTLVLLRTIWSKRDRLDSRPREMIQSFLQRAQRGALSPAQLDAAIQIGRDLGIGHDAPDEPGDVARRPAPQPWGPLPLRPPGRS